MLSSMGIQPPKQSPRKPKPTHQSQAKDLAMLQTLPPNYLMLEAVFKALCTVYDMSRRRGLRTTIEKLKPAIEEACSRRFTLDHLAQLISLLEHEIVLEWIRLPVAPMSARTQPQLLITLVNNNEKPPYALILRKSMISYVRSAYVAYLNRTFQEAVAAGDVETAKSVETLVPLPSLITEFRQGFMESKEARLPMGFLPPSPIQEQASAHVFFQKNAKVINVANNTNSRGNNTADVHLVSSSTDVPGASSVHASKSDAEIQQEAKTKSGDAVLENDLVIVQKRRLSFQTDDGKGVEQPSATDDTHIATTSAAAAGNDNINNVNITSKQQQGVEFTGGGVIFSQEDFALLATLPEELRRRSLNGTISLESIRKLDICAEQIRRLSGTKAIEMRRQKAALAALPKMFSRLERIFGSSGPRAMKLKDFMQRAKGELETEGEIEEVLKSLVAIVPEYVELKAYGGCGTPAVWVNRGADKRSVSQKVKVAAAKRMEMKL